MTRPAAFSSFVLDGPRTRGVVVDAWIVATKWHSRSFQLLLQRIVAKNKKKCVANEIVINVISPGTHSLQYEFDV
jgi:hypothetical protein